MRRPKVRLESLIAFTAVAESRDLKVAADRLGLTASAVRKQIDGIERTLGVTLFEGKCDRLNMTPDGEVFMAEAQQSLEHALLAEEKVQARQSLREHRFAVGHSTYLPSWLIAAMYRIDPAGTPRARVEQVSGLSATVVDRVLEGSLQVGVAFISLERPGLLVRTLHEESVVVCLPSDHRLAVKASVHPGDLDGEDVIAVGRGPMPSFHEEIAEHMNDFGVELRVVADAFAPAEAIGFVGQRRGRCFLAASSVPSRAGITTKPLSTNVLKRRSGVFVRQDTRAPIMEKWVDALFEEVGALRRTRR